MKVIASPAFRNRAENSYNWLLYQPMQQHLTVQEFTPQALLQLHHPDVWHIHWPEIPLNHPNRFKMLVKLSAFIIQVSLACLRGTKIVWTVHNLQSHDQNYPKIERRFWNWFTQNLSGYISLSQAGLDAAQDRFPNLRHKPGFVIPHVHYRSEYPCPPDRATARQQLGIPDNERVVLFFGRMRTYKNVPHLIQTFHTLNPKNTSLYLCGRPEPLSHQAEIEQLIGHDHRVNTNFRFIDDAHTQLYFRAADLVVLPYREILNSGTALLSLSFDCPVLVPARGSMGELQGAVGRDWVQTYEGELNAAALDRAIDWAINSPRSKKTPLENFKATILAQQTMTAYRRVINPAQFIQSSEREKVQSSL